MIFIFHKNNEVNYIKNVVTDEYIDINKSKDITIALFGLAENFPNEFIGWCHIELENYLNIENLNPVFKHRYIMASFETSKNYFIHKSIGYIEDTPFINVKKNVQYPTWLMSSDIGAVHAQVLNTFKKILSYNLRFDLLLNYIAKLGMKKGLFCYSSPKLLKTTETVEISKVGATKVEMLQFIKSTFKSRWILIFLFNKFIYEKQCWIISSVRTLFKQSILFDTNKLNFNLDINSVRLKHTPTIDVIIPTLGRSDYLNDVFEDLAIQTIKPTKVIVVEQIVEPQQKIDLHFLNKNWPFEVDHTIINKLGACNARNIALQKVTSDWVFFADDDIRLKNNIIEDAFNVINKYGIEALSLSCLQSNESENNISIVQSATFGSGTSFVKSNKLLNTKFGMEYEFGYGEDVDFGMQLRNKGVDIVYAPPVKMLHLKAPSGGFRTKIKTNWDFEPIKPKPSPTVMVYNLKHKTSEQIKGYKTLLFFKFYKLQSIRNPFKYIRRMKTAWKKSEKHAKDLINNYSNEL